MWDFSLPLGITRKDCLARLLKLQQALHGSAYSFAPITYILPNDYRKFTQEFSKQEDKRTSKYKLGKYQTLRPVCVYNFLYLQFLFMSRFAIKRLWLRIS